MTATFDAIIEAAMRLSPQDRCLVASRLWESTNAPPAAFESDLLDQELAVREQELDANPLIEQTHESFLEHFASRRK